MELETTLQSINIGHSHTISTTVTPDTTAMAMGSGGLSVYATPAMVALMEQAAMLAVQPLLPNGYGTVGTELNVQHTRALPISATVCACATLKAIEGKRLTFEVKAYNDQGTIGQGTHTRYIIDNEKFMSRL